MVAATAARSAPLGPLPELREATEQPAELVLESP
jgi:hypothetical protein